MENILKESRKLHLESPVKVTINDLTITGAKKREGSFKNATVFISGPEIAIKNAKTTEELTQCYNLFEQDGSTKYPLTRLLVEDCTFAHPVSSNNIFSFYKFAEGAKVTFKNCKFIINNSVANIMRLDNNQDVKNVNIAFENCEWKFTTKDANLTKQTAVLIFQYGWNKDESGELIKRFSTWSVEFNNCKYGETEIKPSLFKDYESLTTDVQTAEMTIDETYQLLYVYGNNQYTVKDNADAYPIVKIVYGSDAKTFRA